ncbi:inaD-like protein isoform X2 [Cimex lectularius]|uniref:PDZ domain-containing protein n=1 Tax=Cimex lectularius TaxID=79782 RepID=A0A8I6TMV4_CIMLE|nr:inaD-like protein isoform X2 [Cimex lectularius]
MVLNTEWAQVEVIDLINDGSGLGFGIIGGRSTGVVVKTILPGGVADRDGRLQSGDHILQIGDVNLRGMGSEQVAAVLRQSGSHVRLVVARPVEPTSPDYQALGSHAPIVPTKILADPEELDRHLIQNGYPQVTYNLATPNNDSYENPFMFHQDADLELMERDPRLVVDVVPLTPALPLPFLTMDMLPLDTQLPEMERFTVELKKDIHGLGITIAGYVCEKEELSGIFVKSISSGSAADVCKKIQVNDRIVEVDGQSLQGYTNHDAVEVLRSTGGTVRLSLERYLRGPKFEQLQQAIANSELKPPTPSSPSAVSLPRFPDGEDTTEIEVEGESVTTVDSMYINEASNPDVELDDVELLIDTDYEGPLKTSVEEAIKTKWSKIMGPDVEIVVGQLKKFGEGGGLGISLEGTVDVEDGQEVRPHHYIRSILGEGPVGQNGKLQSGDELLEVNGHRLLGMNHIEVVTILKELPLAVRMVCARRTGEGAALRLIDTSQDRAAFAARSLLGGSLQNLLPAMERLVKAKSDGSLASTTTPTTEPSLSKLRSRSLEPITGLAMWSSEPHIIELVKGERGLGFSILDYQDPMNPSETVIVIRSLVPGGVAQLDGRLIPGDRLLSVNSVALDNASLDQAVQALKGAPKGIVRIAVAKPLPIPDSVSNSQDAELELSQDTPTLDDHSMYSCSGSIHSEPEDDREILDMENLVIDELPLEEEEEEEHMIVGPVCERLLEKGEKDEIVNIEQKVPFVPLPVTLESEVKIHKASDQLGINLEIVNDGLNGMVVTEIIPNGALAKDGRVSVGDFITTINNESLRHVTQAQAKSILNRVQLLTSDISLRYIAKKTAAEYIRTCPPQQTKYTIQPSPRIFPEYYRSPFIEPELTAAAEIHTKSRSPIYSPLGCESASDRESEYVDCDWIDDRMTGVCSPLTSKEIEGKPPETFFSSSRKLSASSCEIEYISQVISGDEISEPKKPKPAESYSNKAIVLKIDKNSLSISDDTLDFVKELDNVQRPSVNTSIFSRERSLESLHSCKVHVQNVRELSKGLSEPILNSDKKKSEHFRTRRELSRKGTMTVTKTSSAILLANHWGPQRAVHIDREPKSSLGISIVGGKVDLYNSGPDSSSAISGIFIKNVLPNSPAGRTGELKTGDRILEVDGIDLRHASHERAVEVIRASGNPVKFLVQSLVQWGADDSASESSSTKDVDDKLKALSYSEICQGDTSTSEINISNEETLNDVVDIKVSTESDPPVKDTLDISTSSPPKFVSQVPEIVVPKPDHISSSESEESEDDEYQDMEGKIRTAAGMEISRASAGNVKRSKEEASKDPEKEDIFGYTTSKSFHYGSVEGKSLQH